jgi:DNA polymerase-4
MDRSIIHLNVADFAVAVERMMDSRLKHRPVIIAPEGSARASVYDMSEEAYQFGVRKGMGLRRAIRLCEDARVLPPHPDRYERAMGALFKQALHYSPLIEPGEGDGHLFADVTGTSRLFGPPVDIAWRLHKQAKADLGLNPIWSVAPNKLVAKVATRLVKPSGEYIVGAGEEEMFLAPLAVNLVPGIERDDLYKLSEFNLTRISQVMALSLEDLRVPFGVRARFLYESVRGIDASPVLPTGQKRPGVSADHEFADDTNHVNVLEGRLYSMVEEVAKKLRRRRVAARNIKVMLDYSDGVRCVRQTLAEPATTNDLTLFEAARRTFMRAWTRRVRVRHMRLTCDRLIFPQAQVELFADERAKRGKRDLCIAAMDRIRDRFGHDAVRMGRTLVA